MEESKILELFFERNETAIAETKAKFGVRMYKTALNILQSPQDAEECVSDALFKAWGAIPPARPEILGAYVTKIARNLALHRWEASRAAKRGGGEVNLLLGELEDCIPASRATEPERELEAAETTEALNSWLAATDKTTKAVFVLRYFHGESVRDIATSFKISESKTKSILFRARKKLNAHLQKEGVLT